MRELTLIDSERLLGRLDNKRGAPPTCFLNRGAAIVSIDDATSHNWHVTENVLVTRGNKKCVASIWPYSRVESGYVGLDNTTMKTLDISRDSLVTRMRPESSKNTPSKTPKKGSSGKKSSGKKKRSSFRSEAPRLNRFERQSYESLKDEDKAEPTRISLDPLPTPILEACTVQVEPFDHAVNRVEYLAALKQQLVGRILLKDMLVRVDILGVESSVRIHALALAHKNQVDFAAVSDSTVLTSVQSNKSTSYQYQLQKLPKLEDIGGVDKVAESLLNITRDFLFLSSFDNDSLSNGVILHGASGTGKTALSRAVVGELGVHLEEIHGTALCAAIGDSETQTNATRTLRASFDRAKTHAPSVIILNDIDTIARDRSIMNDSVEYSNALDENLTDKVQGIDQEIAQLLDHRSQTARVFVIGTTNSLAQVDGSIRRVGRLDCTIEIELPNASARMSVLRAVSRKVRKLGRIDFDEAEGDSMARMAFGCVHADIAGAWNRAVSAALKRDSANSVSRADVKQALASSVPSRLRDVAVEVTQTKWSDIGGQEAAKIRLRESVELPLSEKGRATLAELQLQPPCGILLYGPPGCSKTLLARAVATESHANFVSVRGPELLSKWVGASEKAVHAVFERARAAAPAVIFFDEIDALASTRDGHAGASAHSRVVAQLLAEMDGIGANVGVHGERVVVIAATNRPDLLDAALLRPGRIDLQIYVGMPDKVERLAILQVHTRDVPLYEDVEVEKLAEESFTGGMSGAEIAALVREAALIAMELDPVGASFVSLQHFQLALQRRRSVHSCLTNHKSG